MILKNQKENIQQNIYEIQNQSTKNQTYSSQEIQNLYESTNDPRYKFLLKNGKIQIITNDGQILIIELPNIPGTLICYRKPSFREKFIDNLKLDELDINTIPLLEGEENIKYLSLQKNKIQKIENMISLPCLIYLNLRSNQILKIDNLQNLIKLKVLIIQRNNISQIKNLDSLQYLEVLNLANNKIKKIDQLQKLKKLKVIKLADNNIIKIENLDENHLLTEIDFKNNKIEQIENIFHLKKLEKLNLSNNIFSQIPYSKLKLLTWLESLSLYQENFDKKTYQNDVLDNLKNLKMLDDVEINKRHVENDKLECSFIQKNVNSFYQKSELNYSQKIQIKNLSQSKIKNEKSINTKTRSSVSPSNYNQQKSKSKDQLGMGKVNNLNLQKEIEKNINQKNIALIYDQWKKITNSVKKFYYKNQENQKLNGFNYANDKKLFIYGNDYEQILTLTIKYPNTEQVYIQYCQIQSLANGKTVNKLKKFKFLKKLELSHNLINQMNQLTCLECLENLQSLNIINNPVSQCGIFENFLTYRFPNLELINNININQNKKQATKSFFINFDKQLQISSKNSSLHKKVQEQFENKIQKRLHNKDLQIINESIELKSQQIVDSVIEQNVQKILYKQMFEKVLNGYISTLENKFFE